MGPWPQTESDDARARSLVFCGRPATIWHSPVMGEAKSNLANLRARVIAELEKYMAPTSPEEERLNDEIRALTFYNCPRVPVEQLRYTRMEPQRCHLNAAAYVRLDPTGTSWHQGGCWKRNGVFYFHSVVLTGDGKLRCVTPHHDPANLVFAPDDAIQWTEVIDGAKHPRRHGLHVPTLVRDFPERVIAAAMEARDKILAGAHPASVAARF